MKKTELVAAVRNRADLTWDVAHSVVNAVFDVVGETLAKKEDVNVTGFGRWRVSERTPREGRNPKTGESLMMEARTVINFKSSGNLKDKVNTVVTE